MGIIEADDRHGAVRVLLEDKIAERQCPDWTMGAHARDGGDGAGVSDAENGSIEPAEADRVKCPALWCAEDVDWCHGGAVRKREAEDVRDRAIAYVVQQSGLSREEVEECFAAGYSFVHDGGPRWAEPAPPSSPKRLGAQWRRTG
jgi:hypothetical protein